MARPRSVSDEDILAATRDAALASGASVSLDEIASRLKVSPPALLKRFGTRNNLILAALRPPRELPFLPELSKGPTAEPLKSQLEDMLNHMAAFFNGMFPCMMVLRESGISEREIWGTSKPSPKALWEPVRAWLERAKAQGLVKCDEIDASAYALIGAITSRIATSHMMKQSVSPRDQRAYIRDLSNLFSRALTSREKEPRQ